MKLRRPLGVRVHLIGAAVAIAIASVAVTGVLIARAIDSQLESVGRQELATAAARTASNAAAFHREAGGVSERWVSHIVRMARREGRVTVLRGPGGRLLPGSPRSAPEPVATAAVTIGGTTVATVETGYRAGQAASPGGLANVLHDTLDARLLEAAVVAGAFALLLALLVAFRLARPLHRLTEVARRMAHGEIETRAAGSGGPRETTELAHTLDRLAAALRRQDELRRATVHDVVHELRNALVGVVGRLEALQDGMVVDEKATIERAARDAHRLNRLIDDVLLLAEAQKPSLLVRKGPVELHEVCSDRANAHADRFAERGIDFDCQIAAAHVDGDPERLAQIVDNLLSNALRYTDRGGRVRLTLDVRDDEAVLEVSDTGIGIVPEHLARIFDRFWRDPQARDRVAEGSGVGLALVRDLVLAHDGRVEAESRPGKGSTFSVFLPVTVEPEADDVLVREPAPEWAATAGGEAPAVWRLRGEIDTANAPRIEAQLLDAVSRDSGDVVLDLTDVKFIDSSGLGSLVAVAAEVRTQGGHLAIVAGPPHVKRVFDLLQLDEVMELVDTRGDAMAALAD